MQGKGEAGGRPVLTTGMAEKSPLLFILHHKNGCRASRVFAVLPPSLCPLLPAHAPGGEPMSLETVCLSMNSDMSSRTMASSLPK